MTFRTRPVLDRRHRPRWRDELRTQQLLVAAFALAIAVALGIFGAAAWNGYWESHFRPVAAAGGTTFDRGDVRAREEIIGIETIAQLTELQAQLTGSPRDQLLQQQIDALGQRLNGLTATAASSLIDAEVLQLQAGEYGVEVSDDELDAALVERYTLPELIRARAIYLDPLPDGADADDEPTQEQIDEARAGLEEVRERVEGGESFAEVAAEVSEDFTAQLGGDLGWFGADDVAYGPEFEALADAEGGELVGPIEIDGRVALLELVSRREATTEDGLRDLLEAQGIDEGRYRAYLRGELLLDEFRDHFAEEVATSPAPQRRVAQIVIRPVGGEPVPQARARHVLIAPVPDAQDQSEATDEQWAAALEEAQDVREQLAAEDADWFAIAEERSADPGSGARGGDLGWYDPAASPFVEPFTEALADLEVGELSEPVRTDFGYHLIQKTAERESPQQQAAELVAELREDPDAFGATARRLSEDTETARENGELGWVAPYQLEPTLESAVFALDDVGDVSEPIETANGITIYQLLETSESREVEADRLERIHESGFERWLETEVRDPIPTWIDPQFATSAA